jgi:hypothetical protein
MADVIDHMLLTIIGKRTTQHNTKAERAVKGLGFLVMSATYSSRFSLPYGSRDLAFLFAMPTRILTHLETTKLDFG